MTFLKALQQSGGQRDGENLNFLNDKELLLSCICRIMQDLLQCFHTQWEDGTENNAASRLRIIMRCLKMHPMLYSSHYETFKGSG